MAEFSLDKIAGEGVTIKWGEEELELMPLTARDYGKLKSKIRSNALEAISNSDIDPVSKRYAWAMAADRSIGMESLLEEMLSPDMALYAVWLSASKRNKRIKMEDLEAGLNIAETMEIVMIISGLADPKDVAGEGKKNENPTDRNTKRSTGKSSSAGSAKRTPVTH